MQVVDYRAVNSETLKGIFSLKIDKWSNCTINDLKHFVKGTSEWINLPDKMYLDNGTKKYKPYIKFDELPTQNLFKETALASVKEYLKNNPTKSTPKLVTIEEKEVDFWKE